MRASSEHENKINTECLYLNLLKRKKEVLKFIVLGIKNKTISDDLFISLNTVKSHRKKIQNAGD